MVLFGFITASSFAAPIGTNNGTPIEGDNMLEIDLFADVQATSISEIEMEAVEGDGIFGAIIGAILGAGLNQLNYAKYGPAVGIFGGAVSGVAGGIMGFYLLPF